MNKISVHATPTDKKDGEDRGVAVVTRRRLRPNLCPICVKTLSGDMESENIETATKYLSKSGCGDPPAQ